MSKILDSCKFVHENSKHVKVNMEAVDKFCAEFKLTKVGHWLESLPVDISSFTDFEKAHLLLFFDSLSFSYWGDPKWTIVYEGEELGGAYSMVACVVRAIEEGYPIFKASYLASISEEDLKHILRGNVEIPMLQERLNILHELGQVLVDKFEGDLTKLILQAKGDALLLRDLMVESFRSFNDASMYMEKEVFYYKRAQLFVADIVQAFSKGEFGVWRNMESLTACADYKLPYVLRRMGIFEYSAELARLIDTKTQIEKDSEFENELRANTIWVVDLITKKLQENSPDLKVIEVNDYLWLLGREKIPGEAPYHYTRSTAY